MEEITSSIKVGDLRKAISTLPDDMPVVISFDNVFDTAERIEINEELTIIGINKNKDKIREYEVTIMGEEYVYRYKADN